MFAFPRSAGAIALVLTTLSLPVHASDSLTSETGWMNEGGNSAEAGVLPSHGDPTDDFAPPVYDIYTLSGMEQQIREFPDAFLISFDQAITDIGQQDPEFAALGDAIKSVARDAFDISRFEWHALDTLNGGLSTEQMLAVTTWLKQPLGRKITEMEIHSSSAEGMIERQQFIKTLSENPISDERQAALTELDDTVGITEMAVSMTTDIQVAMTVASAALLPESHRPDIASIQAFLNDSKPVLRTHFKTLIGQSLTHTYRGLSLQELKTYTRFAASSAGQQFSEAASTGLSRAMLEVSMNIAAGIHDVVQQASQRQTL